MHKYLPYLFTLILLTSCGNEDGKYQNNKVFRMNIPSSLATLDPANASDQSTIWMCGQLYNGLVEFDKDLNVRPSLAKHWTVTDSGMTYTFYLRDDVFFHKSEHFGKDSTKKFRSEDVKYSFTRICDPSVAAKGFWIFNGKVKGVTEYRDGKSAEVSGFEAVNDTTFRIHLDAPFPPFMGTLAMAYAYVVPREVAEHYGNDFRSHPVGTGPFRLKSWKEGTSLILLKNDDYFEQENGQRLPFVDAVHVRFIREKLSEFVEFCQGKLDFINEIDKSTKDEVFLPDGSIRPKYLAKYNFDIAPQLNTEFIAFQVDTTLELMKNHPLADKRVRQAMAYAIDRKKMVEYLLNGNGFPGEYGMVPGGMPNYIQDSVLGYNYDPEFALELLAAAGHARGLRIPELRLYSNPRYQQVMEFCQKSWERIGIKVVIDNVDGPTLREMAGKGEILMWRASWIADYPDPENYLSLFYSEKIPPAGVNRSRFRNAEFDSLYLASLDPRNDSIRHDLFYQIENLVMDEAPVIPLYYDKILRMVSKDISGLETNPMNMLILKRVRKN